MKKHLPTLVVTAAALLVALTWLPRRDRGEFALAAFGELPTLVNGRVKPLDTVARTSLLTMQGRQRVVAAERSLEPVEWLLDVLYRPGVADGYQVFEIVHPDLLGLMGLSPEDGAGKKRFSARQMAPKLRELERQGKLAEETESATRTPFQRAVSQLRNNVMLYQRLQSTFLAPGSDDFLARLAALEGNLAAAKALTSGGHGSGGADAAFGRTVLELSQEFSTMATFSYLRPIPPADPADNAQWQTAGAAWSEALTAGRVDPAARAFARVGTAWRDRQAEAFNATARETLGQLRSVRPAVMTRGSVEARFNSAEPFYVSMALYVTAFLLAVLSWLRWPHALQRIAFGLTVLAFLTSTAGIAIRMWLEARPPVTNLYSSALFVGWGAVALCLILEHFFRNGIGSVAAGLIGFATLLIAHHLALGGDTLEMMRAVLDSNFWLATHVVTITVGYSATFLAGFLALIYVFRGVCTRTLDQATARAVAKMIYGIVCFATLFSLVGTVLGGIWADQSWGRFWGWDPKENGALLIVIWSAIILHARWGGLVRERGLAMLAIGGNIVTAWSWFGVNMLGVGLHSYGFMDAAFWWLIGFVAGQLAVVLLASVPEEKWRSAGLLALRPQPSR
jgi:ABC-type transport system involved in cytochrome c biogenesis permease subunit